MHQRPPMELKVESKYSFNDTVEAVKAVAAEQKFAVQYVHEVSKTLESKGFPREAVTIVEVCNAKAASTVLKNDIRVGLQLPCPVMVYQEGPKVFVMAFDTRVIGSMYEGEGMAAAGAEVYVAMTKILDAVKK